jgi:hypothetical protein
MYGQTTTTDTNCTMNGNTANCTSTSTDDSAQRQAQAAAQAEKDRQGEALGNSMGTALGRGIIAMHEAHQVKKYCKQHPGEVWTRTSNADGHVLATGQCNFEKPHVATVSNQTQSGDPCARLPAGANGCKDGKTVK